MAEKVNLFEGKNESICKAMHLDRKQQCFFCKILIGLLPNRSKPRAYEAYIT